MNSTTSGAGLTHVAFFLPVALLLVREEVWRENVC